MRVASVALGLLLAALGAVLALPTYAQAAADGHVSHAGQSPGGIGIRLVDVPVDELNNPRALAYIIDALPPGTTIHRRIAVNNTTSATQHITLYAGGSAIVNDHFIPSTPNDLSSWIRVEPGDLNLKPGTSQMATVTITIPKGATNGESYATVWAQVKIPPAVGQTVLQVEQVGIRVYLDVTHGSPPSNFIIEKVTGAPSRNGATTISALVNNTGQRAVDISGTVSLTSADGQIHAGPYRQDNVLTLAPGGSGTTTFTVNQALPPGTWSADLTLRSGTIVHSMSGTITVGARSTLTPRHHGTSNATVIVLSTMAGVFVFGGLGYVFIRRRHGRASHD